jgi:hydroxyacylglutathione hydrolase
MPDVVDSYGIRITRLELGPYGTNAYIVADKASGDSLLVDAPAESGEIIAALQGTSPRYIVITHSHFDHTQALEEVKSRLNIPIAVHPLDAAQLPCPADIDLQDGQTLTIGALTLTVLHTPGHTPGSICLLTGKYLLAGDTIFPGGPGHTDSPGDLTTILRSIATSIATLPDDTIIFPGHGDSTILGNERNSMAQFNSQPHTYDLHGDVLWLSN